MENTLAVSVVIGAALGNQYFSTFDSAQQKAFKLGKAFHDTDRKLQSTQGVIKYRDLLKQLKDKQNAAGGSSQKLAAGIKEVEERYKKAKKEAKGYGLSIGNLVKEQKALVRQSSILEDEMNRLNQARAAKDRLSSLKTRALGAMGLAYGAGSIIGNALQLEDKKHQLADVITGENREERLNESLRHAKAFSRTSLASEGDKEKKVTVTESTKENKQSNNVRSRQRQEIGDAFYKPTASLDGNPRIKNALKLGEKSHVTNNSRIHAPITIHVPKGTDPIDIGKEVNKQLQEREHQAKVQQRGALYNYEEYATP